MATNAIYIVLPILNEAVALGPLLHALGSIHLPQEVGFIEILAVNDGSTDDSAAILAEAAKQFPLKVITHHSNLGVPAVLSNALRNIVPRLSPTDVVIVMEADLTSDPSLIPALINKLKEGNDIVIASRHKRGGGYVRFPWHRTVGSFLVNIALRLIWHISDVNDYTIFYRAYSGSLLLRAFANDVHFQSKKSFAANGELLLLLSFYNPKIAELPYKYDYGLKTGPSRMRLMKTLFEYVRLTAFYRSASRIRKLAVTTTSPPSDSPSSSARQPHLRNNLLK